MGLLFIVLPILVIVGAFTWLRPSKRDQELAALRSEALVSGFRIGSIKVPDLSTYGRVNNKNEIVTVYQKSLKLDDKQLARYTAVRTTGESGAYLPQGWAWHIRSEMDEERCKAVSRSLDELPDSVTVLSLEADSISLSWDERSEDVTFEKITAWLTKAAAELNRVVL